MVAPAILIRPADLDRDLPAISELFRQIDAYHVDLDPSIFRPSSLSAEELRRRIAPSPDRYLICAEVGGQVVGLAHFFALHPAPLPMLVPRDYVLVETLVVLASHRGQGVGVALMRAVETKAQELGIDSIRLHVWESNGSARGFYEDLGYETLYRLMTKAVGKRCA